MSTQPIFQPLGSPIPAGGEAERVSDVDPRLTRTHYFDGRLLTADDLNRDLLYLDQRLREAGQTLGSGIMRGLELSFDDTAGELVLQAGVGVTSAGRVLEVGRELRVDLGERVVISRINKGRFRRFNRGLYAVVLRYAEVSTDIAEVFPRDLGEKKGFQYDVFTECVQLGLVPLPQPLPQQHPNAVRANLIRAYLGDGQAAGLIPEDAVALGVLAIQEDRPLWLDADLLRHPLRAAPRPGDVQEDLARHYEALYRDVMATRLSGSLGGDFSAAEYFRLLPPVGSLPKESIDPVRGRQGFFPQNFRVWTAPIRAADLELVKKESMVLPPIDLTLDEPVDVIVLAPLSNRDYGFFARRLERPFDPATRRLPHLDLLELRLYPRRPVHELDTDEATWQGIWDRVSDQSLLFVRRPTRAAETAISGIVLAQGTALPPPQETQPTLPTDEVVSDVVSGPADAGGLILDAEEVFLERVNLRRLGELRPPEGDTALRALETLDSEFGDDAGTVQASLDFLLRVERRYDELVWPTLFTMTREGALTEFVARFLRVQEPGVATGSAVVEAGGSLIGDLAEGWRSLDELEIPR